jgi:hypothetical protein
MITEKNQAGDRDSVIVKTASKSDLSCSFYRFADKTNCSVNGNMIQSRKNLSLFGGNYHGAIIVDGQTAGYTESRSESRKDASIQAIVTGTDQAGEC